MSIKTGDRYEVLEPDALIRVLGQIMAQVMMTLRTGSTMEVIMHMADCADPVVVELDDGIRLALTPDTIEACCRRVEDPT